ncbi:hypothetical protein SRHO_G00123690 [Serrasalmus rhombeus]
MVYYRDRIEKDFRIQEVRDAGDHSKGCSRQLGEMCEIMARRSGPYKRYLESGTERIPRRTKFRWNAKRIQDSGWSHANDEDEDSLLNVVRSGGGTGLLIANGLKHTPLLPTNTYTSFEYHATLVNTPAKLGIIVIYRPPGQMGEFTNELDMLLSSIPDQDCPMLILGDMNIHLDSPCSTDFISLMHSFDLEQVPSPPTHKAGKNLHLIFTRNCDNDSLTVTPLHLSDHYFIQLNVCIEKKPKAAPTMVSFRRNLRDLSADQYSSLVTDNMPPPGSLSSLNENDATDTLCSTLSSCLDDLCPLTTSHALK